MSVQLAQQAQEIVGKSDVVLITERVDDVALRIGQMVTMGLPEVLDRHIPRHWTQRGMSWGWTAVIWLASILTEGDHRNVSVATSLTGLHHTLSRLTAQVIEPLDFRDDRLSPLLKHLRKKAYGHQMAQDLMPASAQTIFISAVIPDANARQFAEWLCKDKNAVLGRSPFSSPLTHWLKVLTSLSRQSLFTLHHDTKKEREIVMGNQSR